MAPPTADQRKPVILALALSALIVVAVLAAFHPALSSEFVDWDDRESLIDNPSFRGLSPAHLSWMLTTTHMGHYQPLSWLSLAIDHAVWGLDPRGFHLTNVLIHAATAVAVFFVLLRLLSVARATSAAGTAAGTAGGNPEWMSLVAAAFGALAFAIHPLRCESVAWVTERRDVLSGFCFVLTIGAWLRYAGTGRRSWYVVALVALLASLLAKASGVVTPIVLIVLDLWPLRRRLSLTRLVVEKLPFFALSLSFGVLAVVAQHDQATALITLGEHGLVARLAQACQALVFYVAKTCVPVRLSPIYELVLPLDPFAWRFAGAAVLVAGVSVALVPMRRRFPAALAAWTIYVVILAPVSGLLQAGPQLVADRYSYLSCLPWAALAAGLALSGLTASLRARAATLAAMPVLLIAMGVATSRQTSIWRDSESLWSHALRLDPEGRHALLHLGTVRLEQAAVSLDPATRRRALTESESLLARGSERSNDPLFLLNLGLCKLIRAEERPDERERLLLEAEQLLRRAIDQVEVREPAPWTWRLRLATVLVGRAQFQDAVTLLERVVAESPDSVEARRMIAVALSGLNQMDAAAGHLERAVELDPQDATLWLRLGLTDVRLGRPGNARAALEQVVQLRQRQLGAQAAGDDTCRQALAALAGLSGP